MLRVRVFKAVDDIESCNRFLQGHLDILKMYGVTKVTSAKTEWFNNDGVYVVIVEDSVGKVVGGVRLHVANGTHPLPLETATQELDPSVFECVRRYAVRGTGELCGLWNAKEVAGWGIGTKFLMRAGISLTNQLNLNSLFALCAEHTLKISLEKGFSIEDSLGNNGTFYYPKEDLVATAIIIKDPEKLSLADPQEREYILNLRRNPYQVKKENSPKGEISICYDLNITKELSQARSK